MLRREGGAEVKTTTFPVLFRSLESDDLLTDRLDFLPIGFGSVTSIGGVGPSCFDGRI
ncbi:hypothetical protein [Lacrimispora indolis]|uniref:hypothetical protein n=1 Tax=Lacrimispora indolis TaxID=69825 RepID=UPI0004AE17BF|nr:hypothetical protein [Lacrimispora indolis]